VKRLVAGGLAAAALLGAGTALSARGYADPAGDANDAPDITSVSVAEATAGTLTIGVSVGNYQTLPSNSWVNVWFDLDSDPSTGDDGDEAVLHYSAEGLMELYAWNGSRLVEGSTSGITGTFAAGVLTLSLPRSSIHAGGPFGLLAVGSRGQGGGQGQLIASDFAPDVGRSAFAGTAPSAFPDPSDDEDAAPDITSVRVSDAKRGWVTFAITMPNYAALPAEALLIVFIDADSNRRTGDDGAEFRLSVVEGEVSLERWDVRSRSWRADRRPTRARVRSATNVVSVDVHVSELGNTARFGFSLVSADVSAAAQAILAVDFAPEESGFWSYTLANKPALALVVTRRIVSAARPRAGEPFTVGLAVARSDTRRPIASGSVTCKVQVAGKKVPAMGQVRGGVGRCTFDVPATARGATVRGTITVRSGGKTVSASFAFVAS
jgi:hypothetical protein